MTGIQLDNYIADKLSRLKDTMINKGINELHYHSNILDKSITITPKTINRWIDLARNSSVDHKKLMIAANEIWKRLHKEHI